MKPPRILRCNPEGFEIDDDLSRLDFGVVHGFLTESYWSTGIPRDTVERAARASWSFGVYAPAGDQGGDQVGFARLVTDYSTFAYLADVFILEGWRGRGLSKWLMAEIFALPVVAGMRRIMLATRTAHGLYEKSGFKPWARPDWFMEVNRPEIYQEMSVTAPQTEHVGDIAASAPCAPARFGPGAKSKTSNEARMAIVAPFAGDAGKGDR